MPHLALTYDINSMYQIIVDAMHGLWPILAAAVAIGLVTLLLGGIVWVFRFWRDTWG